MSWEIIIDVVQDTAHKVGPLPAKQNFGQQVGEIELRGHMRSQHLAHCHSLTHGVVADGIALLS